MKYLRSLILCVLCYVVLVHSRQNIQNNVIIIERCTASLRHRADEVDKYGGDSSKLRADIKFYEDELAHYRAFLHYTNWL